LTYIRITGTLNFPDYSSDVCFRDVTETDFADLTSHRSETLGPEELETLLSEEKKVVFTYHPYPFVM